MKNKEEILKEIDELRFKLRGLKELLVVALDKEKQIEENEGRSFSQPRHETYRLESEGNKKEKNV